MGRAKFHMERTSHNKELNRDIEMDVVPGEPLAGYNARI
jgi:hypothetical protein